ncbi:hypothetical protein [Rathayibacter soli]|uniref:hypothetical protein n=1 Tax=Rathayibacter soli TaxID=3144168 RepID=UPI0027E54810|nr:hypothetical protein [Glaciibacter superstes]
MIQSVVVEGSDTQFKQTIGDVRAIGWSVHPGWGLPGTSGATALAGAVANRLDATLAVTAGLTGVNLIVHGLAARSILDSLCEDLRHLGRLNHRIGEAAPVLTDEDRQLLRLLADGVTIAGTAQKLHLSRRSVDRRIAALREQFAATSVSSLLLAYRARLAAVAGVRDA